ncbi:MAG: hypothetical protein RL059_754 [Bacteroidota bacterium]
MKDPRDGGMKATLNLLSFKMSTVIEDANKRANEATESLRRAEEELREWKVANQPLDTLHSTYLELKAEVTACRAREERAQQTLVELSKHQTAQIISERDLLLNRSIIDWNSNIPRDSHLYVNTALFPE